MRVKRVLCISTVILLICAGEALSEAIRVGLFIPAIERAETGEDESTLHVLTRTLLYYIEICDTCTAVEFDTQIEEATGNTLAKLCADFGLDSVVFLSPSATIADFSERSLNLYHAASGTIRTQNLKGFDFSGPSYAAAHRFLESFLDETLRIAGSWGTLELNPRGADGHFSIEIDGVFGGDNINSPFAVPPGTHVLTITQKRPFGPQILLEERTMIRQGSKQKINFAVPELTDLERRAFEAIDTQILGAWESNAQAVKEQLDLVESLFEGIRASDAVSRYRDKYKTWRTEYQTGRVASRIVVETPGDETEREEIAAEIEKDLDLSVVIKEPQPVPGMGSIFLASLGPLINRTGGVIHALVHDAKFTQDDGSPTHFSYANLTYDIDGEDGIFFWSVLGLWGGGGIAESLLFPYPRYTLSPGGKAVYAVGIAFDTMGDMLTLLSRVAGAGWSRAEYEISAGKIGITTPDPEEYRTAQALTGYCGYASWALGTAASVTAPLIHGERSKAVSGGFHIFLHTTGSIFKVLGNLSSLIAYNSRLLVDIRSRAYDYADFSSGNDDSYERYESAHSFYLGSTIATYAFWGLGAVSSILAVILPEPRRTAADSPVGEARPEPLFSISPRIEPDYAGVMLWL